MKYAISTLVFAIALSVAKVSAQPFKFQKIGFQKMTTGTITRIGTTFVIEQERPMSIHRFVPVNLPDRYKEPGIKVAFSGDIGRVPPNVRMVGRPIKLRTIKKLIPKGSKLDVTQSTRPAPQSHPVAAPPEKKQSIDSVGFVDEQKGTIMKVAAEKDLYIIQANHGNMVTNYIPNYIPEDFKEHGLEVKFSGIIGRQTTNVMQIGKPFEIKNMTEIKAEAPEPTPTTMDNVVKTKPQKDSTWVLEVDSAGHLQGVVAKVVLLFPEQGLYALETHEGSKRYLPVNLPKEYKQDGLKVKISGVTGKIPPNVRLVGTPLKLKRIKLVE